MKADTGTRSAASETYGIIKDKISRGVLPAGARLTEQGLAAEFGMSRTPVREAMRMLVAEGILDFKPNSGTFVGQWSDEEVGEIFHLRLLLESEVAELAAQHITGDQILQLEQLQDDLEAGGIDLSDENLTRISLLNRRFHHVIATASRNVRLVKMLSNVIEMPIVQRTFHRYTKAQLDRSFHHHRELIDALKRRNQIWARSVMQCHISSAKSVLLIKEVEAEQTHVSPVTKDNGSKRKRHSRKTP
jgi:DNA-binding GntR family transcriptional regulator